MCWMKSGMYINAHKSTYKGIFLVCSFAKHFYPEPTGKSFAKANFARLVEAIYHIFKAIGLFYLRKCWF